MEGLGVAEKDVCRALGGMVYSAGPGHRPGIHTLPAVGWAAPFRGVRRGIAMAVDYEVTYILRPNLEENEVTERTNAIGEQLKNNGGEVLNTELLGKKRLAYEINDVR